MLLIKNNGLRFHSFDPVAVAIGIKPRQVAEITRSS